MKLTKVFIELKTKPPSIVKKKGKDEYYFKTQPLNDDAVFDDLLETSGFLLEVYR
jgi:hypothetical protein